jgi:hypothetical protein
MNHLPPDNQPTNITDSVGGSIGDSRVRQAYLDSQSSNRDAPSLAMDDAIRAAARRAVNSAPQTIENQAAEKSVISRYRVPLSAAAVLVLTTSLVTLMSLETPNQVMPAAPPALYVDPPTTPVASTTTQSTPPVRARNEIPVVPVAPATKTKQQDSIAQSKPIAPIRVESATVISDAKVVVLTEPSKVNKIAEIANALQPPAATASAPIPATPAAPPAVIASATPGTAVGARLPSASLRASAPAPQAAVAASEVKRVMPTEVLPEMRTEAPAEWVKRILVLHDEKKLDLVKAELVKFKKIHPAYELPKALAEIATP